MWNLAPDKLERTLTPEEAAVLARGDGFLVALASEVTEGERARMTRIPTTSPRTPDAVPAPAPAAALEAAAAVAAVAPRSEAVPVSPPETSRMPAAPAAAVVDVLPRAKVLGLKVYLLNNDLWVANVAKDSAAQLAGIQAGDRLVTLNGEAVGSDKFPLLRKINAANADAQGAVEITWQRPTAASPQTATVEWSAR